MNRIAFVLGAAALALASAACAAPTEGDGSESGSDALISGGGGGGGQGFVCTPFGCACDPSAGTDDPVMSCAGMDEVCKRMGGKPPIMDPSTGWLHCRFSALTSSPTSPAKTVGGATTRLAN
jgi:hypothetical protein